MRKNVLSFDFGASNGRAILGKYDGETLEIEEIHRFENTPVTIKGTLHWDIEMLFDEVKKTLQKVSNMMEISSIAVDTWGVDFGLLDESGTLIDKPVHYRDKRTENMSEEVNKHIPLEQLYELTGNQIIFFNTIFQLAYMNKYERDVLEKTESLLLMPDLFNYLLTGEKKTEVTIGSTTQLFEPKDKQWNEEVIKRLGLPGHIFKDVIRPGETVGQVSKALSQELQIPQIPVVATASHDTASAVVSVPAPDYEFLFVSCGTWSLIGTELEQPIITSESLNYNITNESGINGTTRFLKNVTGLWVLQEVKRQFEEQGKTYTYDQITKLAEEATPFKCMIDVDHKDFEAPGKMLEKIQRYAEMTQQSAPETDGEIFRTIYESMALKYRVVFEEIMDCTNNRYEKVNIVGGGSRAGILCQMVANSSHMEVISGPVEATVIGNSVVQLMAQNAIKDIAEGRKVVQRSFNVKSYVPENKGAWQQQFERYQKMLGSLEKGDTVNVEKNT